MANVFGFLFRDKGSLPLNIGVGAIVSPIKSQHLNLDDANAIYSVADGAISYHDQGLPFDVNGRLVVTANAVARVDQGVPFAASGAVCATGDGASYTDQGCVYTAAGDLYTP